MIMPHNTCIKDSLIIELISLIQELLNYMVVSKSSLSECLSNGYLSLATFRRKSLNMNPYSAIIHNILNKDDCGAPTHLLHYKADDKDSEKENIYPSLDNKDFEKINEPLLVINSDVNLRNLENMYLSPKSNPLLPLTDLKLAQKYFFNTIQNCIKIANIKLRIMDILSQSRIVCPNT